MQLSDIPKLVVIFRRVQTADVLAAAEALIAVGIDGFEVTFEASATCEALPLLVDRVGDAGSVGAGTVLTSEQVEFAASSGASFVLSPNFDPAIVAATKRAGLLSVPGALTPTEIVNAVAAGADVVKVFPIAAVGGADYIAQLRGPLPDIQLIATGGVTPDMARRCAAMGCAVAVATTMIDRDASEQKDWQRFAKSALEYDQAVKEGAASFVSN